MKTNNPGQLLEMLKFRDQVFVNGGDYRGQAFQYRKLSYASQGERADLSGCVFYKCVSPIDERDPNALYIACYPSRTDFDEELESLKQNTSFEQFDFTAFNIDGCVFDGLYLDSSEFQDMVLRSVSFVNCILSGANFYDATLIGCDFTRAQLEHASFHGAEIEDCSFYEADMEGADIDNFTGDISMFETASYLPEALTECDHCDRLLEKDNINIIPELSEGVCDGCYEAYEDQHTCERCGVVDPHVDNYSSLCSECELEDEDEDEDDD